jgi:Cu/Zn superoxide dismutase
MINNNIDAFNLASNRGMIGKYSNIKVDANGNVYANCETPETDAEVFDVVIDWTIVIHQAATIAATTREDEISNTKTKLNDGTE